MSELETVRVVKDHSPGYATINKSDFDPAKHELYESEQGGPTVIELKAKLKEMGVSIPRGATKADMLALMPGD